MANLVSATIASYVGDNVSTATTGTYTYKSRNDGTVFIIISDTAGIITGTLQDDSAHSQYVGVGVPTRVALKTVNLATTRAALPNAVLSAIPL